MIRPGLPPIPQGQSARDVHFPAPVGGTNTVAGGSGMPITDCIYAYNLVAAELGLRTRLGSREWVTGLDGPVRAVLPFFGATPGSAKLFVTTPSGIWDATASTTTPHRDVVFESVSDTSGRMTCSVIVNAAGHFLLCWDEDHGYYVYRSTENDWVRPGVVATEAWVTATDYKIGDKVLNDSGKTYLCTQAGTSDVGPTGTGTQIPDGGAIWDWVPVVTGVDPEKFVSGCVWKGRVICVERDSARAWYFGLEELWGTATKFEFGHKFAHGGHLVGLWDWTQDGGIGADDYLVAVSSQGDVSVWQGPGINSTDLVLRGVWWVGGVPAGRAICTPFGGELMIMATRGVVPLSPLLRGTALQTDQQYVTYKISNLFSKLMASYGSMAGWGVTIHPLDNTLMILPPTASDYGCDPLVMSLATKGWTRYRGLSMTAAAPWAGNLYYGTADGRVLINDGVLDGVKLSDGTYEAIQWKLLWPFQKFGTSRQKRALMARPTFLSDGGPPTYKIEARFRFDTTEVADVTYVEASTGDSRWDVGLWDEAEWQDEYTADSTDQRTVGLTGIGTELSIALAGASESRVTLVGVDVTLDVGGIL